MVPTRTGSTDASDSDETPEERHALDLSAPSGSSGARGDMERPELVLVPAVLGSTDIEHGASQTMPLGNSMTGSAPPSFIQAEPATPIARRGGGEPDATDSTGPHPSLLDKERRDQREYLTESGTNDKATPFQMQAGMPRNFRISVDGYTLLHDEDGTFAAYRINVTAGLHQWQVLRR